MVGIYKYGNGLWFTGIIANTKEEAEAYLGNKHGHWEKYYAGEDEEGNWFYKDVFVPYYNKEAFEIKELTII